MTALRTLLAAALAALASLALAGPAAAFVSAWPTTDLAQNPAVSFGTLPNGLRYAIRHNGNPAGGVSLRLVIEAGSMNEAPGQEGLAHMIEHMAFRGSAHVADGEIMQTLQRLGLRPGADANAATGAISTSYRFDFATTGNGELDTGLRFFREIAGELTLSQDALNTERNVVLAEGRQRDGPGFDITAAELAADYPGHPATRPTIGRDEVIEHATSAELRAFYDAYYRPERAVIIVVGDIDPAAAEAKIRALFSDWQGRGPADVDPPPYAPTGRGQTVVTIARPNAPPAALSLLWVRPYQAPEQTRAGAIEAWVRSIGERAIDQRTFELKQAAGGPFITARLSPVWLPGVARGETFAASGVTDVAHAVDVLTTARRQLITQGLTQSEVDYVVLQARAELQRAAAGQSSQPGAGLSMAQAGQLANEAMFGMVDLSDQQVLDVFEAAVRGLTAERVNQVLRDHLQGEGPVVFFSSATPAPTDPGGLTTLLAQADAATLAAFTPPATVAWTHTTFGAPGRVAERREAADLGVTMVRFANGVRLTLKPLAAAAPGQVVVQVRFGHGRLDQPRDRLDSSDWSMTLLELGGLTDLRTGDVGRALAGHSVRMVTGTDEDAFSISSISPFGATVPAADLDLEMQYLAATMTAPGWRADGWQTLAVNAKQAYATNQATAGGVFQLNYRALLHPGDQRWVADRPQDIATFTPAAARAFIAPIMARGDIEVIIAGDVTPESAIAAVARTFGALPRRHGLLEPRGARVEHFPAPTPTPVVLHDTGRPDQAFVDISWPTTDQRQAWPDMAPAVILANILRQRVTDRLRTHEGETYTPSAGAEFSRVFPGWGRISLAVQCKPDAIGRVWAAFDEIAADLAAHPVSDDELQRALKPQIEAATRARTQAGYWIAQLADAQADPARLDYIRQTLPRLTAVTAADVQRVAQRWLRPDRAFRIEVTPTAVATSVAAAVAPAQPPP